MYKILILMAVLLTTGCSTMKENAYFKVGAGYKFQETPMYYDGVLADDPISARFELGTNQGNLYYGVSHHSQWASGYPLNNDGEYGKTEIFIDYKFELKDYFRK